MTGYANRLIEVDLPIKRISAHARREKVIRHGHISTLHIWWARRPLAACRAVICAALWPDPADDLCPEKFKRVARERMLSWSRDHLRLASAESAARMVAIQKEPARLDDPLTLRRALLDFIADFANWDNSSVREYLDTSPALTQTAHEALGGVPGTKPLVVDPFAGGGAIPLEALRVGADTFASDLNPVAVLLNKVVLEYIPKYGQRLADEVRKWGEWIKREAEKQLAEFYPRDPDGATPIAYLWARTIQCEGPGCGAMVPLIRSLWMSKRGSNSTALRIAPLPMERRMDFELLYNVRAKDVGEGTVRRGSVTCPICGYTTPVASVRAQLRQHHGGSSNAQLCCVVTTRADQKGRAYRKPTELDGEADILGRLETFLAHHTRGEDLGLRLHGEQLAAGVRFVRLLKEGAYHLVVGNPPYQGTSKMADADYVKRRYPLGKADLYAAFLIRGLQLAREGGTSALLTMRNWMFIKQYADLRLWLLERFDLRALGDFDRGAFEEVPDERVALAVSAFRKGPPVEEPGVALQPTPLDDRSRDSERTRRKRAAALSHVGRFNFREALLRIVPDRPLLYWWRTKEFAQYQSAPLVRDVCPAKFGLTHRR